MTVRTEWLAGRVPGRLAALTVVTVLLLIFAAFAATAAPKAQLWARWNKFDDSSNLKIDHSVWTGFLSKYVRTDARGINLVAYGAVSEADRDSLDAYIERLSLAPIGTYSRKVQLAYWINLYNALTVRLVLDNYPVDSIRDIDISPGWFVDGPWRRRLVEIDSVGLSLDDIEHRILRPIWKDPRIHYALNRAALGSPNLTKRAFTGETVDRMLTRAARDYVNGLRGATFEDGDLYVSALYRRYIADFGGTPIGILIHMRKYAEPHLRERLGEAGRISGYRFDWSLNADPASSVPGISRAHASAGSALLR